VLNYQQYNEYYSSLNNNIVTTQIAAQGYGSRNKVQVNQRQIASFVSQKPTTGQKNKSNSLVYKTNNTGSPKDNPILMKLIDKSKIKEFNSN
jgi:hypothetical protein